MVAQSVLCDFYVLCGDFASDVVAVEVLGDDCCCSCAHEWVVYDVLFVGEVCEYFFNEFFGEYGSVSFEFALLYIYDPYVFEGAALKVAFFEELSADGVVFVEYEYEFCSAV